MAALEEERRRDELCPVFELGFERRPNVSPELEITNGGPLDYDEVEAEIIDKPTIVDALGFPGATSTSGGRIGAMRQGETHRLAILEDRRGRGGELRLRITCRCGERTWIVLAACDVYGYATISVPRRRLQGRR